MAKDISVIIPTFQRTALLSRCLEALVAQDFEGAYEIIVVSDGEDVSTQELCKKLTDLYPLKSISFTYLKKQSGPASARNEGVRLSSGKLIAFTDDDTIPSTSWLSSFYKAFQKVNEPLIAFSGQVVVPHNKTPSDWEKNISQLESAEFVTANCAISKAAFIKCGGFDEMFTMAWREDSDLHFKLLENDIPILKLQEAMVTHPVRPVAWGISLFNEKKNMFNSLLYKRHPKLYKQKIGACPKWNYYAINLLLLLQIYSLLTGRKWLFTASLGAWGLLIAEFAYRRLKGTRGEKKHILEMIATSALIPHVSVYWKIYGSLKFKQLLL